MKQPLAIAIFVVGLLVLISTIYISVEYNDKAESSLQSLAIVCGLCFFLYKLLTGWLFINLNVKVDPDRQTFDNDIDNLSLKVILSKGNTDSVWIKDIEIRLSEIICEDDKSSLQTLKIKPIGTKKTDVFVISKNEVDYWKGKENEHYVISPNEEAIFSAFTRIKNNVVISAEILVIGTRPFYSLGRKKHTPILWKSSIIIFPNKKI